MDARSVVFRQFNDDGYTWESFRISERFISWLESKHMLKITKKLGEGMSNTGLLASNMGNKKYPESVVILVMFGGYCEENKEYIEYMTKLRSWQERGLVPTDDMIKIYEPIVSPLPPTDDPNYCPGAQRTQYTLQVIEPVDHVLTEVLYKHMDDPIYTKVGLIANMIQQLQTIYTRIYLKGYRYSDVLADNVGVTSEGKLIMIDLSISKETREWTSQDLFEIIMEDLADSILTYKYINPSTLSIQIREGKWKDIGTVPFISSQQEGDYIRQEINNLVSQTLRQNTLSPVRPYMIYTQFIYNTTL